jgi:CheY-like chemotaxis protein
MSVVVSPSDTMQPFLPPLRVPEEAWQKESDMTFNVLVAAPGNEEWPSIADGVRRQRPGASILRVKDGEQAVRFLFHRGLFTEAPEIPDLIVLARELPTVPTEAIVARLRQHPRTDMTPVIVVGRGENHTDLASAREYTQWLERQQWLIAVGTDELEGELAEAVQRLCGDPPAVEINAQDLPIRSPS